MAGENDQESGSELRKKLEEALGAKKQWASSAAAAVAAGFKYVKPEDILDVDDPAKLMEKAQEVEAARKAEADNLLRQALVDRGVAETDIDSALEALSGAQNPGNETDSAADRIASLGSFGGEPHRTETVRRGPTGKDTIMAGLSKSSK